MPRLNGGQQRCDVLLKNLLTVRKDILVDAYTIDPAVDGDADLDLKIRGEQDQRGTEDGPQRPAMRREHHPGGGEDDDAKRKIEVEPERARRPENLDADASRRRHPNEIAGIAIPERHRERRPGDRRQEEQFGSREKGNEHWVSTLKVQRICGLPREHCVCGERPQQHRTTMKLSQSNRPWRVTNPPRRPGLEPGPKTTNVHVTRSWGHSSVHNGHRRLWVPAFAGTSASVRTL